MYDEVALETIQRARSLIAAVSLPVGLLIDVALVPFVDRIVSPSRYVSIARSDFVL